MRRLLKQLPKPRMRSLADLARAVVELARARMTMATLATEELLAMGSASQPANSSATRIVERVQFAIPRAAARVPWRSDCLVQALAGRNWLLKEGVPSTLIIGATNEGGFAAHAWLDVGGVIVTGKSLESFVPLLPADEKVTLN